MLTASIELLITAQLVAQLISSLVRRIRRYIIRLIRMLRQTEVRLSHERIWDPRWRSWTLLNWGRRRKRYRGQDLLLLLHGNLLLLDLLLLILHIPVLAMRDNVLLLGLNLLLRLIVPAPFLFQFVVEKSDAPASLLPDLVKDLKNFFLFTLGLQTLCGDCEGAERDACNTTVFDVSADAANELRVSLEQGEHLGILWTLQRIDLSKKTHAGVIEEPGNNRGSLNQPYLGERGS